MKKPLVSIIIPVYNGSNYLKEAIDSALSQTYKKIEVIVVNDGSTDNGLTDQIAKKYSHKIRYFLKKNGGVATALNYGIEKMKGDWFSWLSHDDVYTQNKIELMVNYLQKHSNSNILYSDYKVVDSKFQFLHDVIVKPSSIRNMQIRLMYSYPLNGCAMLIHKRCITEFGGFDETLPTTQDYDLWFRMAKKYTFNYVPIISLYSRLHAAQGSHVYAQPAEADDLYVKFMNQVSDTVIRHQLGNNSGSWLLRLSRSYKMSGYVLSAKEAIKKSKSFHDQLIIEYLYTKFIYNLPDNLINNIIKLRIKFELPIFKSLGILKSITKYATN